MGVLLGNEYLAWIESAVAGTSNPIKGQGSFNETRSEAKIDTSDKTTEGFATGSFGLTTWAGALDVKVNLPDANGFSRLEAKCKARPKVPFIFQIRKGGLDGADPADVVFEASVYGTLSSVNYNKDGTVDAKVELALEAAPTVDTIA